ncbi:hypothetical protein JCM5350_003779 [Sporobolomyces pararoseus]
MPLWSTSRSSSYNSTTSTSSTGGPPQLPPLPQFTPPSTSHLPHFESTSSTSSSSTPKLSKLSINDNNKGKSVQQGEDDDDDDPWGDDSEDEETIKSKHSHSHSTTITSPTSPSSSSSINNSSTRTTTTTSGGGGGGGGWFSSFTSPFSSSSSSSSSPSVPPPTTSHPQPQARGGGGGGGSILRRQPSAKDLAIALSPSNSPSFSSTAASNNNNNKILPLPHEGLNRSGQSYLGKVNEVQKEADQIVQEKEQRRSTSSSRSFNREEKRNSLNREEEQEEQEGGGGGGEGRNLGSSEKEKLRKSIRKEVFELVQDPTSVLPRLRKEWLSTPTPPQHHTSTSSSVPNRSTPRSTTTTTTTDSSHSSRTSSDTTHSTSTSTPGGSKRRESITSTSTRDDESSSTPTPTRLSISSDLSSEEEEDGKPKGYVPLNVSSLSSASTKHVVVDYQKDVQHTKTVVDLLEDPGELGREIRRKKKFLDVLQGIKSTDDSNYPGEEEEEEEEERFKEDGETDLSELRKLSWGGIPKDLRVVVWMLLLGYLPSPFSRRQSTLARKRQEYRDAVKLAFSRGVKGLDGPIWHQISIDVPRTRPGVKLWMVEGTQRSLERILYVWAIRHPASGYVQGINDLVTPFFQVFLSLYIDSDPEEFDPSLLPPCALEALEADSFWCLSKLLDGIQDNYIFAQPGITRAVKKMELLCKRVDAPLAKHLQNEGVEFIQFAFRWMNCLLMRELSVKNIVRMWDTYLAEGGDAFSEFHLYVCLSFLVKWSEQLRTMDFQSIIIFLQSLPTKDWKDSNTELLLSEAFMWSRTFEAR